MMQTRARTTSTEAFARQIRTFVVDNFLFGDGRGVADSDSLIDSGIVDSTGAMELVAFLEDVFGIAIEDADLIPENLDSIRAMANFVRGKLDAPAMVPYEAQQAPVSAARS